MDKILWIKSCLHYFPLNILFKVGINRKFFHIVKETASRTVGLDFIHGKLTGSLQFANVVISCEWQVSRPWAGEHNIIEAILFQDFKFMLTLKG